MKRAVIQANVWIDIVGESIEEIHETFSALLAEAEGAPSVKLLSANVVEFTEKVFVVPPGAERWPSLADIRFGEDFPRVVMWGGSWWWTNGHACYRCEGDPPEDFHVIESDRVPPNNFDVGARRPTSFGAPVTDPEGALIRVASVDDLVAVQDRYLAPILAAYPAAHFTCGPEDDPRVPVRAYDAERLVAVVMPFVRNVKTSGTVQ